MASYPIKHLSASAIKKFNRCPYSFKAKYILGLKEPKNQHLAFGSAVHHAQEMQVNYKLDHGEWPDVVEVLEAYQQEMAVQAKTLDKKSTDALRELYSVGHRLVELNYDNLIKMDPIGTEEEFLIDLGYFVPIKGFLDLSIVGGIGELKTTGKWYTPSVINSTVQFTIYDEYYYAKYGVRPRFELVELNKNELALRQTTVKRNMQHREKLDLMVAELKLALDTNNFPRCHQRFCFACNT